MRLEDLHHVVAAAAQIVGEQEFVIVGSQAILASYPDAPESLLRSQACLGKEALERLARALGYRDSSILESRAAVLWRSGAIPRPEAAAEIRAYLDGIPVMSG